MGFRSRLATIHTHLPSSMYPLHSKAYAYLSYLCTVRTICDCEEGGKHTTEKGGHKLTLKEDSTLTLGSTQADRRCSKEREIYR